ncbi:MAG: hypothetical protein HY909_31630 [Deltaproteobacteria bacterium]|nr:hypothetical protein [Deltaproteobacteria bacterium]
MRAWGMLLVLALGCKAARQEPRCVPGHLEPCPCPGSFLGIMQCQPDGTYDICACPDAGPPEERPLPVDTAPPDTAMDTQAPPDTSPDGALDASSDGPSEGGADTTDGATEDATDGASGEVPDGPSDVGEDLTPDATPDD